MNIFYYLIGLLFIVVHVKGATPPTTKAPTSVTSAPTKVTKSPTSATSAPTSAKTKMDIPNTKYFWKNEVVDWPTAKNWCEAENGNLTTIKNEAEFNIILEYFTGPNKPSLTRQMWIGINDNNTEGTWGTVDGTPITEAWGFDSTGNQINNASAQLPWGNSTLNSNMVNQATRDFVSINAYSPSAVVAGLTCKCRYILSGTLARPLCARIPRWIIYLTLFL